MIQITENGKKGCFSRGGEMVFHPQGCVLVVAGGETSFPLTTPEVLLSILWVYSIQVSSFQKLVVIHFEKLRGSVIAM